MTTFKDAMRKAQDTSLPTDNRVPRTNTPDWHSHPATESQINFLRDLIRQRCIPASEVFNISARIKQGLLTKYDASRTINHWKTHPAQESKPDRRESKPKVGDRRGEDSDPIVYCKDGVWRNLAGASAAGRQTGTCAYCGRTLTNPTSIKNGIGPICMEKFA